MAMAMGCSAAAATTMRCAPSTSASGAPAAAATAVGGRKIFGGRIYGGAAGAAAALWGHGGRVRRSARSRVVVAASGEEDDVGDRVMNAKGSAEEEAAGLAAVLASLEASSGCPSCDDETALWFLRDRKMDVEAAAAKLEKFLRWRAEVGDITDDDIASSVEAGAAYVHPHLDVEGRAVIIVEIAKHVIKERDLEAAKKHAVRAVEECIRKMEDTPGGSDAIYAVWDMKGFSGSNADLDLAKFCILDVFREYYPKRLSQVAAIDSPWAFKPVWAILKPIIGKYSSVVQFCKVPDVVANFKEGEAPACLTQGDGR